jgi:hypothetical protein
VVGTAWWWGRLGGGDGGDGLMVGTAWWWRRLVDDEDDISFNA